MCSTVSIRPQPADEGRGRYTDKKKQISQKKTQNRGRKTEREYRKKEKPLRTYCTFEIIYNKMFNTYGIGL